nr:LacI family DNA-binding transcriptional regulator [Candidatus Solirubrobacter pratensis]
MARRPTMKDVAALAGVSLSTVSRTINGDPKVAPDLAARVRHAVGLLGYQRDEAASALRRADRVSASVAIIIEDVANPFFSAVHRGVEDYARERGVLTLSGSSDDAARERALAEAFVSRRVDGLVIAPAGPDHRYLEREHAAGLRLVFVDRPGHWIEADAALSDNAGGARAAVEHLMAAGHRRIAYLGDRAWLFTASERFQGHRTAVGKVAPGLVHQDLGEERAYAVTREVLAAPDPPTALFTSQNLVTLGAVRALHDLGVRDRVAHVGFDDVPLADALAPGLTVVAQDPHALGRTAGELLFARMNGEHGPPRRILMPTRLIRRGSGELAAVSG